ncbi:DUF4019 domain-containing protein [Vreelandella olivaria]|uniref:DUF4019 domain-containing protein n=1 Tax=Vreelandella olivaria TaxID=390919 RepID=UPI00201F54B8|nr:DUF4019 domain-containing protein [Halomonas olivaria]
MPKPLILLLAVTLLMFSTHVKASVQAAEAAALAWLEAIDNGEYEQAWEASSPLLQRPLSPSMLRRTIALARQELGPVQSRQRVSVNRQRSMPGAPDGDYIVFTFHTRFENKARAIETITPHFEAGTWRVSGYYVQ